jgi:hypothetical protein
LLTTKQVFILNPISQNNINIEGTYKILLMEYLFYIKNKIIIVYKNGSFYSKLTLLVKDNKEKEKFMEKKDKSIFEQTSYFFIVSLYRCALVDNDVFLKVFEMPTKESLHNLKMDSKLYYFFTKSIYEKNIELLNSVQYEDAEKNKKKLKFDKSLKVNICFCLFNYQMGKKDNCYKFVDSIIGWFRPIVMFNDGFLVIFNYNAKIINFVEIKDIYQVVLNRTKLILIIYRLANFRREKIVLYSERLGVAEFDAYKDIFVFFIEKSKKYCVSK